MKCVDSPKKDAQKIVVVKSFHVVTPPYTSTEGREVMAIGKDDWSITITITLQHHERREHGENQGRKTKAWEKIPFSLETPRRVQRNTSLWCCCDGMWLFSVFISSPPDGHTRRDGDAGAGWVGHDSNRCCFTQLNVNERKKEIFSMEVVESRDNAGQNTSWKNTQEETLMIEFGILKNTTLKAPF